MCATTNSSHQKKRVSRRGFLSAAAGATAVATVAKVSPRARAAAVKETLGVGFIGVGGRGSAHVRCVNNLMKEGHKLKITAVCDAYRPRMEAHAKAQNCKAYMKHKDLLADKNVDVVCIASPDRLHLPQGIDAVRAGKDVYCEKPMGHWSQIAEAKQFRDETMKHNRIVQVGTQGTSSQVWGEVGKLLRKGIIGEPRHVQAGYYRNGDWGERMKISDPNARPGPNLDWQAFLGDAPKVPFTVDRFFSWRKYLDYAGGPSTDLLPHVFTPFVYMLQLGCPDLAIGSGGIYEYTTYDREVPDTFNMSLEYPEKLSVVLVCTLANDYTTGPVIRGNEGALTFEVANWEAGCRNVRVQPQRHGKGSKKKQEKIELKTEKIGSTEEHWRDFFEGVRKRTQPRSDVTFGYRVHAALAMAMQAYLKKKVARFDAKSETVSL